MMDWLEFRRQILLTRSLDDAEALAAIRRANEMMDADSIEWEDFLEYVGRRSLFRRPPLRKAAMIRQHLDSSLAGTSGKTLDLVKSLNAFYSEHLYLSEKQMELLSDIYWSMVPQRKIYGGFGNA